MANEIFQDDWDEGGVRLRTEANPFLKACAEDPVALLGDVFRWAHDTDPEAVSPEPAVRLQRVDAGELRAVRGPRPERRVLHELHGLGLRRRALESLTDATRRSPRTPPGLNR
ncbi:hypothetical protein [Myceligenerans xiligouense]|uniref:hypothetical protein n=1 Tax=Myceligenerans xiligouense TaxID=253184 RepID=UPI001FE6082C|nr:hypothetical protein [Myceligenerans xiligouense]